MTTYAEMNEAWQLVSELIDLRGTRDLQAANITRLTISAETTQGLKVISFAPADQGWSQLLSRINTNIVDKIAALKTRLAALQITEVPN